MTRARTTASEFGFEGAGGGGDPRPVAASSRRERRSPPPRRRSGSSLRAAIGSRHCAAEPGSSGHESASPRVRCLVLAVFVVSTPAHAGSYDVYACGGPRRRRTGRLRRHRRTRTWTRTRSVLRAHRWGPASSPRRPRAAALPPYFAGAYQVFTAPPGASLQSVTFTVGAIRLHDYWSVGIVAFNSDSDSGDCPTAATPFRPGCGIGTPTFNHRTTVPLYNRARFRFETRCGAPGGCPTTASGFTPGQPRAVLGRERVRACRRLDRTGADAALGCAVARPAGTVAMRKPGPFTRTTSGSWSRA